MRFRADGGELGEAVFAASGKVIQFPGFLRAYVEGSDDPNARLADQEAILPPLSRGQQLEARGLTPTEHSTQPPARFTEASLVKELEERGIGRPSTYAAILETIQDRGYVWKKGSALVPTFTAFAVTNLLEQHLTGLVEIDFTARMEDDLDSIASGDREANRWLHDFYFGRGAVATAGNGAERVTDVGLKELVSSSADQIDARAVCSLPLGKNSRGEEIEARVGRFGPYLENAETQERATLPDGLAPDELTIEKAEEIFTAAAQGDRVLGEDPETSKPIYLKTGRFGPYVQLGDAEPAKKGAKKTPKPKMASLWKGMEPGTVTLEDALNLLSFPKTLGTNPNTGEEITVQDGRYGPYLKMGKDSRSLKDHEHMASITLDQAVEIYQQPKQRGRAASTVMKEIGEHPDTGLALVVKNGRFGPYVTDGVVNATVPKGQDPTAVDLDRAVELIAAREQKMRDQGKDPRAPKKRRARRK